MNATILIVDDNASVRENLSEVLGKEYQVRIAASADEAYAQLAGGEVELALLDLHLQRSAQDYTGFEVLKEIRRHPCRPIGVIMFTVQYDVATAVQAMQLGADDYLPKDCSDEELLLVARRLIENVRLKRAHLFNQQQSEETTPQIIGRSPALLKVLEQTDRVADTDSMVLILGESGSGKELIARRLHEMSWRREQNQPFVAINCAAIPQELAESELFGHEKGAFTNAKERRVGKFEFADQGTIFLDEVDSMPPALQGKLLRALEDRTFEPLGGNRKVYLRARLVTAAKGDLQKAVEQGKFRDDLYFRLQGVTLRLPPLRQRPEDIPLLVEYFLRRLNQRQGRMLEEVDAEAMEYLKNYDWPGNIRQLCHAIESVYYLAAPGTRRLTADMLLEYLRPGEAPAFKKLLGEDFESMTLPDAIELLKDRMIKAALKKAQDNVTKAADILGISRRGLQKMLPGHK